MKKKIIILIMLLLSTGCTCEYNLEIDGNTYHEEINILATNSDELSVLNNNWKVPIDKDEYNNISGESGVETNVTGNIYDYKVSNNNLTFNYDFTSSSIANSTAISTCYDKATIEYIDNLIIISTSNTVKCFTKYPSLTNIEINIKTDKKVTKNNADTIKNNTYTWNLNINDTNKSINMIIENEEQTSNENTPNITSDSNSKKNNKDYTLYIFCTILLVLVLIGYFVFKIYKNKKENI